MAINKKSFVLYSDQKVIIDLLTDEQAGKLFKHLLAYVNDENPVLDDVLLNIAFAPIKLQLKRDLEKWDDIKLVRSKNGKAGGVKSAEAKLSKTKQTEAKQSKTKQSETNEAVNVNVNDNVINNIDSKQTLFKNSIYFDKAKFKEAFPEWSTEKLKHYYDSALDWSDSKGKLMKDWKATIRGWARKDEQEGKIKFDVKKPTLTINNQFALMR
jgi:hypothetical protein